MLLSFIKTMPTIHVILLNNKQRNEKASQFQNMKNTNELRDTQNQNVEENNESGDGNSDYLGEQRVGVLAHAALAGGDVDKRHHCEWQREAQNYLTIVEQFICQNGSVLMRHVLNNNYAESAVILFSVAQLTII